MTDQAVTEPGHEPIPPVADDHHAHDAHGHNSPEAIRREVRVYLIVFGALAALTVLTVFACYGLKLPVHYAIMVALAIACMKGFLVAGFFMHLLSEKKLIYGVLILTVFFFGILMWAPTHDILDKFGR
ncbi:MAG: cytochrome C oxidase subunit IV family protein [Thermoanaerobaculia bacterium]